jgi:hypothetical protein
MIILGNKCKDPYETPKMRFVRAVLGDKNKASQI